MMENNLASQSETCQCSPHEQLRSTMRTLPKSDALDGLIPFYWKTQVITYNVHRITLPPVDFHPRVFYPNNSTRLDFDMIAVGLQEMSYIPACYLTTSVLKKKSWAELFERFYSSRGFVRLSFNASGRLQMVGMLLLVFVRRSMLKYVRKVEVKYVKTGFNGYSGHKGAICARIVVGDSVSIVLVNCHLNPDPNNAEYRVWEYNLITEKCRLSEAQKPADFDYVLWFGDMNFRVQRIEPEDALNFIRKELYSTLLEYDQLTTLRRLKVAFHEYDETDITFKPSYKYLPGTSNFDPCRLPSYCDRILYRKAVDAQQKPGFPLEILSFYYGSFPDAVCSDHKPVSATFMITSYVMECGVPPILFESPSYVRGTCWLVGRSNICRFVQRFDYTPGLWDWIGVYKMDFANDRDVVTYAYMLTAWEEGVAENGVVQNILFKERFIPPAGKYLLGCFSRRNRCLIALSDPFEVIDPRELAKSFASRRRPRKRRQTSMPSLETYNRKDNRNAKALQHTFRMNTNKSTMLNFNPMQANLL
uniref:IPPc domain-containing protein n=1 Tax=Trichuris muris TaxID=70415 RepID=A0A5S6QEM7_TRIMR